MNAKISRMPQWCIDIVTNPPRSGEGFHNWIFRAARALWKCGRDETDIGEILENAADTCGRFVPKREIEQALQNSRTRVFQPALARPQYWPSVNHKQREAIIATGSSLVDLWEVSPVRIEDSKSHTEEIIDTLFPNNPLLCAGRSNCDFATHTREEWRGKLAALQLIVPTPMTARIGRTQEGKESAHALKTTGLRRFLVIEFDRGGVDEHATLLLHLAARAPLAIVVHSGNKSLHGWFYCAGQAEERLQRFMRYTVSLGADRATWTRSQFVRMPDGTRVNGKRQTVYFFNPEVIKE
jgi:hypothetical protein